MIAKIVMTLLIIAAWVCGVIALQNAAHAIDLDGVTQVLTGFSYGTLGGAVALRTSIEIWSTK